MNLSNSERLPMLQWANNEAPVAPPALFLQLYFSRVATREGPYNTVTAGRTGFVIRCVRNHVDESRAISRLGLDLDCLIRSYRSCAASRLNEASHRLNGKYASPTVTKGNL